MVHDVMIILCSGDQLAFSLDGIDVAVRFPSYHQFQDLLPNVTHVDIPVKVLVRVHCKEEPVVRVVSVQLE